MSPTRSDAESRCFDIALGEAWIADAGTPLPKVWCGPPEGFRYGGAVGTAPNPDPDDYEEGFPAIRLEESDDSTGIFQFGQRIRHSTRTHAEAEVEWHDTDLAPPPGRMFVLVVVDKAGGWWIGVPVCERATATMLAPVGRCARLRATYAVHPHPETGVRVVSGVPAGEAT